jgi:SAM-dependent methyltransferase
LPNAQDDEDFCSSLDRFLDIAFAFRNSPRVLDVGSGGGILASLLSTLGHEVYAVDFFDRSGNATYQMHPIVFKVCNIEADPLPFEDGFFDAISCCQTFEHFTHSQLLHAAGFSSVQVSFLRDERIRTGAGKIKSLGSYLRNSIPSLRKSLIGFGRKG